MVTGNRSKRLLYISFIEHVTAEDIRRADDDVRALLADFRTGFRLLTNLEQLDSMDNDCAQGIGQMMELLKKSGIERVARVTPDPD